MSHHQETDWVNRHGANGFTLNIEVWDGRQARYCVHGLVDSLWTDSITEATDYLAADLAQIEAARLPAGPS